MKYVFIACVYCNSIRFNTASKQYAFGDLERRLSVEAEGAPLVYHATSVCALFPIPEICTIYDVTSNKDVYVTVRTWR